MHTTEIVLGIILGAIIVILNLPSVKGMIGEWIVSLIIGKTDEKKQFVLHNVIFSAENGKTSQVDHIVINDYGIWTIETKNYAGRIYGKDNQQNWTQVLKHGKIKNHFYNPVRQNYTHIRMIASALHNNNAETLPTHSVIVFVRNNIRYIDSEFVVPIYKLGKSLKPKGRKLLSKALQKEYFNTLSNIKQNQISTRAHIANIEAEQQKIKNNICPRCGKALVLKYGRYGKFYACPGYPECKFTKKINNNF